MTTPWYQSNSDIHHHNWGNHHHCKNTTGTPRPSPLALSIEHSLHTMSMPTNVKCFTINIVITFSIFVGQIIGYLPKLLLQIAENSTWQTLRQLAIMGRKQNSLKHGKKRRYFFPRKNLLKLRLYLMNTNLSVCCIYGCIKLWQWRMMFRKKWLSQSLSTTNPTTSHHHPLLKLIFKVWLNWFCNENVAAIILYHLS